MLNLYVAIAVATCLRFIIKLITHSEEYSNNNNKLLKILGETFMVVMCFISAHQHETWSKMTRENSSL